MDDTKTTKALSDRYQVLPTEVRELFEYGVIEQSVLEISRRFNLSEEDQLNLENQVALTFLFFFPSYSFTDRLLNSGLQVNASLIPSIAAAVHEELFVLTEDIFEATDERFISNPSTVDASLTQASPQSSQNAPTIQTDITEPKTDSSIPLERVRTMGADAERVHGYGAYRQVQQPQADSAQQPTARQRDPLASLPRYTNDEPGK